MKKGLVNFWGDNNDFAPNTKPVRLNSDYRTINDVETVTREQYEAALAQTEWSGEGLPPVGGECERSWCGDKWLPCTVLFVSDETVVVKLTSREAAYGRCEVSFRPIRSKRQTAVQAMCDLIGNGIECDESTGYGKAWYELYDATAAGKIPGVKLSD